MKFRLCNPFHESPRGARQGAGRSRQGSRFPAAPRPPPIPVDGRKNVSHNDWQLIVGQDVKLFSVIAVIVLVAVLFVLIAPMVHVAPAVRLVRAVTLLIALLALSSLAIPRHNFIPGQRRRATPRFRLKESLPAIPILDLGCVLLC